jgi:hypothetical protein
MKGMVLYEMDDLKELMQIDWQYVIVALFLLLICIKFVWSLLDWLLFEKLGIETRKMKQKREETALLRDTAALAKTTAELAKTTAENLDKLQRRHAKDEEEFRNNLNDYIKESRKDRMALHDEMTRFTDNRINDRKQSLEIQKELKDSIKILTDGQYDRDEKINNLTDMFVSKEIDDLRFKILDFASSISSGMKYNRESYDHILKIYGKYEQILEEHNMENGLVEESVKYIQSSYQELLKTGMTNYL